MRFLIVLVGGICVFIIKNTGDIILTCNLLIDWPVFEEMDCITFINDIIKCHTVNYVCFSGFYSASAQHESLLNGRVLFHLSDNENFLWK